MQRNSLTRKMKNRILTSSRNKCAVCGSEAYLEIAHIKPIYAGGDSSDENLIVLCPTCHMAVDSSHVPSDLLQNIKADWLQRAKLGMGKISDFSRTLRPSFSSDRMATTSREASNLRNWSEALKESEDFDKCIALITETLRQIRSEDKFVNETLKPLFDRMGYEGVTVLHHNRLLEHGKDLVFFERESLGGGFTIYAVVACIGSIHSSSSKSNNSAHYQKILDQVHKCFEVPYTDHNMKADLYVDKVVVACSGRIGDGAMALLRAWEDKNRRRLIFLDAQKIAGHKLRLHKKSQNRRHGLRLSDFPL